MWSEATEFTFDQPRFAAAFGELEEAAYAGCALALVVTPVDGLVIESEQVALGDGLTLVRGVALQDAPPELRGDEFATVAMLSLEGEGPSLEQAGRRLRRLQTALRLWDDAEPALGPTAWARTDGAPWLAIPLATGLRRTTDDCLLAPEEEDPLRAFCSLVARRTPRSGELAWALRRFELGCERGTQLEALTDWLLCARALLAEPDGAGYERLAERMAAICAVPGEREELAAGLRRAIAMERGVVAGIVRPEPAVEALVGSLGACLRAILRDVLCGHLDPELRRIADELLADVAPVPLRVRALAALAQLDRRRRGEQHRHAGARVARRGALLAQDRGRPRPARVELRSELRRELARHEAEQRPVLGRDGDRVGVVDVAGVAPQLQRASGRGGVRRERLGMVAGRAGDPRDPQSRAPRAPGRRARGRRRWPDRRPCIRRARPRPRPRDTSSARPTRPSPPRDRGYARMNRHSRAGVDPGVRRLRIAAALAACAAALALPACGSDDEPANARRAGGGDRHADARSPGARILTRRDGNRPRAGGVTGVDHRPHAKESPCAARCCCSRSSWPSRCWRRRSRAPAASPPRG